MPDFNRQFHYEFGAIGILGTSNVIGILEILTHDDNILQVGFQLAIGRVFPMGFKRSLNNVISEIQRAAEHAYNLPMTPQDFGNILLSLGASGSALQYRRWHCNRDHYTYHCTSCATDL